MTGRQSVPSNTVQYSSLQEQTDTAAASPGMVPNHLFPLSVNIKSRIDVLGDLGADSLAIVELVLALEEEFEIDIPDEDTEKIATVGDAIKYIQEHVK